MERGGRGEVFEEGGREREKEREKTQGTRITNEI